MRFRSSGIALTFATLATLATLASLVGARSVHAQIVNGSLTGLLANTTVPTGWSVLLGSPDTMDENDNIGVPGNLTFGTTPSASPNAGTWVGIGTDGAAFNEAFGQIMSGLVVGQTYTVSWFASNFGYVTTDYLDANAIEMLIDGTPIGTAATIALGPGWVAQSMSFTADATSQQLAFTLGAGTRAYLGIDGISIMANASSTVPEPRSLLLVATGLGALVPLGRRRSRRVTKQSAQA